MGIAHVHAGVLESWCSPWQVWRFTSASLVRVRRIARLAQVFDADPQLAALAADLIEENTLLRNRLID
jgi:chaperone modulatory protein CbpM